MLDFSIQLVIEKFELAKYNYSGFFEVLLDFKDL